MRFGFHFLDFEGIEHMQVGLPHPDRVGYIEKFAETVAPRLLQIEVRSRD